MSVVQREVARFAGDTRHRASHYETAEQSAMLIRKMLATHIRAVPWQGVYMHVSPDDFGRMKKRAEPLDLGARLAPPAEFYVDLANHVDTEWNQDGVYNDFVEKVNPGEHSIVLYLAKATDADTRRVVNQLYSDGDQKERVYNAMVAYGPLKHKHDTEREVTREIGEFIRNLTFPKINCGEMYLMEPVESNHVETPVNARDVPVSHTWAKYPESNTRYKDNVSVAQWKTKHGLNPTFPSRKAAKQMITMYYAPDHSHLLGSKCLGKFQHADDLLSDAQEWCSAQDVASAYKDLLGGATEENIETLWNTPQVTSFVEDLVRQTPTSKLNKLSKHDVLVMMMQQQRNTLQANFVSGLAKL